MAVKGFFVPKGSTVQRQGVLEVKSLLMVIDAHALVHRAYHTPMPSFSVRKTGEPTKAVFGFINTVLKAINELKPTHWAIAFDRPGPTFRHARYEEYKATRPRAPEELVLQFRRVRELVQAFNMPIFEVDGYEADDVIGTLCFQAQQSGMDTIIITGDTDTVQLISPRVRALIFRDTIPYDEARVEERYGIKPTQIADLKALKGDPSDNIPGVPGVGEKTAAKLLQQFGSIEELYRRIDEVNPPALSELLRANEDIVCRNKELTTILRDLPIKLNLFACKAGTYNRKSVLELFRELEFTSIIGRLPLLEDLGTESEGIAEPLLTSPEKSYSIVDTPESLDGLVSELSGAKSIVIDVESTSLNPMSAELVGVALSTAPGRASYIPLGHRHGTQLPLEEVLKRLRPFLDNPQTPQVAHNGKYDMGVLSKYGVEPKNLAFDTMVAAYLLGEKRMGLKELVFERLGIEMTPITALIGTGKKQLSMAEAEIPRVANYACADADMTGRLADLFEKELQEKGLWKLFSEVEMPLVPVLFHMERNGVYLDIGPLKRMSMELGEEMAKLEAQIYNLVGHRFNINSPQQLSAVLFQEIRLPKARKTKSGYSTTDAAVLEALKGAHPVVELILQYRQLAKLKSTYIDALPTLVNPQTGRVHTSFNQTVTATGRLSSSDPNLQNIPIRSELGGQVRQAFVAEGAPDWLLLSADYSQIDLRVLAHLSNDPALIEAFHQNEDIHASTASHVFGVPLDRVTPEMRRLAKVVNFGIIYGMSDYGLSQRTELSREEAASFIDNYFQKYPYVMEYMESTKRLAHEQGYVQTILGRRRYIPDVLSSNAQARQAAERMAINMPVQGTAADIIKVAMVRIHQRMQERRMRSKMTLQVHDELIFEVPREELDDMKILARETMSRAMELRVPLRVDLKVGTNWGEMG